MSDLKLNNININTNNVNNKVSFETWTQRFMYHLVTVSPWPMNASIVLLFMTVGLVEWFHGMNTSWFIEGVPAWLFALGLLFVVSYYWFKDITVEATYVGDHTALVQTGLVYGFVLFVISEVFFFISIFWAYLHSALVPTVDIGGVWPPFSLEGLNPYEVPLVNTVLLLVSAMILTSSHHNTNNWTNVKAAIEEDSKDAITNTVSGLVGSSNSKDVINSINNNPKAWTEWWVSLNQLKTVLALGVTIVLAIVFTAYQYEEYTTASFTFADSIFGSVFYFGTGFHGIHVIVGTIMLTVSFVRFLFKHMIKNHIVGYENGILYYHFVDIVWLGVFVLFYWWAWLPEIH